MKSEKGYSLSTKIIFYVLFVALSVLASMFLVFEQIGKKTLYDVEREKAELVAKMFAPQIGINLYLGFDDKVDEAVKQIMTEKDILAVYLIRDGEIIKKLKRHRTDIEFQNETFQIETPIFEPGGHKRIAVLQLHYSSHHYREMVEKMTRLLLLFFSIATLLFIALAYQIRKRLIPLKKVAVALSEYDVNGGELKLDCESDDQEIKLIINAVEKMQENVGAYAELQENMKQILSQKVHEKTAQLWQQLYTDQLTGLPNRRALMDDLSKKSDALLAIVNIDDFTEINDLYGHRAGDIILKNFADALDILEVDRTYRISGDEFALIKNGEFHLDEAKTFLEFVRSKIERTHFYYEENRVDIRVTIGATIEEASTIEEADMALKEARKQRKPIMIFSPVWNLESKYRENIYWIRQIKSALARDGIVPYCQPLYDIEAKRIKGYEILVRLIKEDGEVVSPHKFLPLAQKSHQYQFMTMRLVERSCAFFKDKTELTFSINISVEDILNTETVAYIKEQILHYNIAHRVVFELLESENIEKFPEVESFVNEMKGLGCQIAIDDFGTGYSNFSYLIKLKADYIKIDGSLIRNIHNDKNAQVIVESIVDFAKKLGIRTVAEFVSSEMIFEKVSELGIDVAQGYYIMEPVPMEEVESGPKKEDVV
ncbi:diguanylate cyclase/phosphodiesterase (GGDEF & EAL domains) with PAS/PAC sensor [Hydrogenimonas sp.]|nr:diguanylate cyclase/phosphodiesterase (GGDEF & EAL domains) with PAS/PAC sensor [Hydrogenimonas sp.]